MGYIQELLQPIEGDTILIACSRFNQAISNSLSDSTHKRRPGKILLKPLFQGIHWTWASPSSVNIHLLRPSHFIEGLWLPPLVAHLYHWAKNWTGRAVSSNTVMVNREKTWLLGFQGGRREDSLWGPLRWDIELGVPGVWWWVHQRASEVPTNFLTVWHELQAISSEVLWARQELGAGTPQLGAPAQEAVSAS